MKFINSNKINIYQDIKDYEIIHYEQYTPLMYIIVHKQSTLLNNSILTVEYNGILWFQGSLLKIIEDKDLWIGIYGNNMNLTNNFYEETYETYHTTGGYFNNKNQNYESLKIYWDKQLLIDQKVVPFTITNGFNITINSIIPNNLKININYVSNQNIQQSMECIKSIPSFINKDNIIDLINKTENNCLFVENIIWTKLDDHYNKIKVKYENIFNYEIRENLSIEYIINKFFNYHTINLYPKEIINNHQQSYKISSAIDENYIHKIIKHYFNYQEFNYWIHIDIFFSNKLFYIGQWISLTYENEKYYGIIKKIVVKKYNNYFYLTLFIKGFKHFLSINYQLPVINKNIHLNLHKYRDQWVNQWDINTDENPITIQIPNYKKIYETIDYDLLLFHILI